VLGASDAAGPSLSRRQILISIGALVLVFVLALLAGSLLSNDNGSSGPSAAPGGTPAKQAAAPQIQQLNVNHQIPDMGAVPAPAASSSGSATSAGTSSASAPATSAPSVSAPSSGTSGSTGSSNGGGSSGGPLGSGGSSG
jgi:hypothetical protein